MPSGGLTVSMALFSSAQTVSAGQSVTFTVMAGGSAGPATGTVAFEVGSTVLGTADLSGSDPSYHEAYFTTTALPVGPDTVTAAYNGDANYAPNSATVNETVQALQAPVYLSSSLNPSVYGQSVTLTASLPTENGVTPTGGIIFRDGTTVLATPPLTPNAPGYGAQATLVVPALSVGSHSITAEYDGDANFSASTSSDLSQTVNQATTTTTLESSAQPALVGVAFNVTATVTGQYGGTPTGTVTFTDVDSNTVLGTGTLDSNGQATLSTYAQAVGTYNIAAEYDGDANFIQSSSEELNQNVAPPIVAEAQDISVTEATAFSGTVASFTSPGGDASPSSYVASIDWGDGESDQGVIQSDGNGGFLVSGSHTYAQEGVAAMTVSIQSTKGVSVMVLGAASVSEDPGDQPGGVIAQQGTLAVGQKTSDNKQLFGLGVPLVFQNDYMTTVTTWEIKDTDKGASITFKYEIIHGSQTEIDNLDKLLSVVPSPLPGKVDEIVAAAIKAANGALKSEANYNFSFSNTFTGKKLSDLTPAMVLGSINGYDLERKAVNADNATIKGLLDQGKPVSGDLISQLAVDNFKYAAKVMLLKQVLPVTPKPGGNP